MRKVEELEPEVVEAGQYPADGTDPDAPAPTERTDGITNPEDEPEHPYHSQRHLPPEERVWPPV